MLKISFGDSEWTTSDALLKIFFADFQADWEDQGYVNELSAFVFSIIAGRRYDAPKVLPHQKEKVRTLICELKKNEYLPTIRADWTAPPLIWLRFAFQALAHGIAPSTHYLKVYARWRFERALTNGLEMVHQITSAAKDRERSKTFRIGDRTFNGYTLDDFLLNKKIKVDPGSKSKCELSTVPSLNGKQESTSLNTSTKKSTKPATKQPRDIRRIVGERAYAIIKKCVDDAAQSRSPRLGLSKRKIDGRYKSKLSRVDFIEILLERYKSKLPFAESTIRRAITDFVAFPNYRRSWAESRKAPTGDEPA